MDRKAFIKNLIAGLLAYRWRKEEPIMHVFAINRDGGLIPASEAKSGIVYHCPICNCEMYRTSRKGTDYYACMDLL